MGTKLSKIYLLRFENLHSLERGDDFHHVTQFRIDVGRITTLTAEIRIKYVIVKEDIFLYWESRVNFISSTILRSAHYVGSIVSTML